MWKNSSLEKDNPVKSYFPLLLGDADSSSADVLENHKIGYHKS